MLATLTYQPIHRKVAVSCVSMATSPSLGFSKRDMQVRTSFLHGLPVCFPHHYWNNEWQLLQRLATSLKPCTKSLIALCVTKISPLEKFHFRMEQATPRLVHQAFRCQESDASGSKEGLLHLHCTRHLYESAACGVSAGDCGHWELCCDRVSKWKWGGVLLRSVRRWVWWLR